METSEYFTWKDWQKNDWDVDVNLQAHKGDDEYDVIIIGAGLAGLTCGARLSKRGFKILLVEQHHQVGGVYTSFKRKEFLFNSGAFVITGLWDNGPIDFFLRDLGVDKEDYFVKSSFKYNFGAMEIDFSSGVQDLIEQIAEKFPYERANINAFFEDARKAMDERFSDSDKYGIPLSPELIVKVYGEERMIRHLEECPHHYDWMKKSFRQKLDEHFESDEIKDLINFIFNYLAIDPAITPADVALRAYTWFREGSHFPLGGAQKLSDFVKDYLEKNGGKVLLKTKVDKILTDNQSVLGVVCGDKAYKAPVIVSNSNVKTTFLDLIDSDVLETNYLEYVKSLEMAASGFIIFLGLDKEFSGYPTVLALETEDGFSWLVFNSNSDPYTAPEGKTSLTIFTTPIQYSDFPDRGTEKYQRKKDELRDSILKKAEKTIPGLNEHITVMDAGTPKTFERYLMMPEGSVEGIDGSVRTDKPCFKTPIKGLYLAGQTTHPGSGIELAIMSGLICANDILDWKS